MFLEVLKGKDLSDVFIGWLLTLQPLLVVLL